MIDRQTETGVDTHNCSIDSIFIVVLLPLILIPDEELHSSETLLRKIEKLIAYN